MVGEGALVFSITLKYDGYSDVKKVNHFFLLHLAIALNPMVSKIIIISLFFFLCDLDDVR